MANITDFTNISYCGKEANEIFSKDIFDLGLANIGITLKDGVKGKQKIYTGEIGEAWQEYSCDWTPKGLASLAEAYIEPVEIKVNQEQCLDEFWDVWMVENTRISLQGGIPEPFNTWYFGKLRQKMNREYEEIFWQGDTARTATTKAYLKVTDGIEKKLNDNSGVTKISGAVFTVDNILAQVEAAINSAVGIAADGEIDMEGYKVFMNYSDVRVLEVALGKLCCDVQTNRVFSNYAKNGNAIYVLGFEIVPTMQSRNTVIVGPAKNLVLGFDTFDSHQEYKIIDMRDTLGINQFRILAISNIAVGIVFPELFVYSRP